MIYTQEEKVKMDTLLRAFLPYVDSREDYDVLYSSKAGYIRVITGASCDQIYFPIDGYRSMVQMFTDDFLSDEEMRVGHYLKRDYDYVRSLLMTRLDTLGEHRKETCEIMEDTFEAYRVRCEHIRQSHLAEIHRLEELIQHLRDADI